MKNDQTEQLQAKIDQLEEELASLKKEKQTKRDATTKKIFQASKFAGGIFLGKRLKKALNQFFEERRSKNGEKGYVKNETYAELFTALIQRFTRVGLITFILGIFSFTAFQTYLLFQQNSKLETQNKLFNSQNEQVIAQTKLFANQNKLVEQQLKQVDFQNELLQKQTTQLDTQNVLFSKQNVLVDFQLKRMDIQNHLLITQNRQLEIETQLSESNRRSSLVFLMSNILDKVDQEIKDNKMYQDSLKKNPKTKFKLSSQLEGRIIALSKALRPYLFLEGKELNPSPYSPERGQLLTALVESKVEMQNIIERGCFEDADLSHLDITGANLINIQLIAANLQFANLPKLNLKGADLTGTNLEFANLRGANLKEVFFSLTKFASTDLRGANLKNAFFPSGSSLRSTIFDSSTKLDGVYTFDLNFLSTMEKVVINDQKNFFNFKKYYLIKIDYEQIKKLPFYKSVEFMDLPKVMYQVCLKPNQKEE